MVMLFGVPSNSFAFDEWSKRDYALQTTWIAIDIIDWGQTRHIAKNPQQFHENNPTLGGHPSVGQVDAFFISGIVLNTAITHILPSAWRPYWQAVSIGFSSVFVVNNYRLGLKIDF